MTCVCHAVGCTAKRGRAALMCRDCWFKVPMQLRRRINETWRGYQRGTVAQKLDYFEARDEAIRFVAEGDDRLADFVPETPRMKRLYALREG